MKAFEFENGKKKIDDSRSLFMIGFPLLRFCSSVLRALRAHKTLAAAGVVWLVLFVALSCNDKFDRLSGLRGGI